MGLDTDRSPAVPVIPGPGAVPWWQLSAITAMAYAAVGWLSVMLAGPPAYVSPLYPSAGIALAAALRWGTPALPGVWLGALLVNGGLAAMRGQQGWTMLVLPAVVGVGAALQAGVGAALVRRFVSQPLVLNSPRDILNAGVLGALLACTISPSIATPALLAAGTLLPANWLSTWLTWWIGDTLGVLIAAPAVLTLIGRPRADWAPRRLTLGLPLLLALLLMAAAMNEWARLDEQRVRAAFERDADRLGSEAQARMQAPLYALQALHGAALSMPDIDAPALRDVARWWLGLPMNLQAFGYSVRVPQSGIAAFELAAQAQGLQGFRVFDRDGGKALASDGEVVAIRQIEPRERNAAALGVNALSIPAARDAILASRRSGQPAATSGFPLTQANGDETGVVLYQALFDGPAPDEATRQARFRGVVFVTVRADALFDRLSGPAQQHVQWCVVDTDPNATRRRFAGPPGCEMAGATGLTTQRPLLLGGRQFDMRLTAQPASLPAPQRAGSLLLSLAGLSAAAMLGALLLTITGQSRRTQLAVHAGTVDLRREIDERALAQNALRDSETRLRSILDHVPIGVVFLDADGRLIECNPHLCQMLGQTADSLRGVSLDDISHPDELATNQRERQAIFAAAALADGGDGTARRQMRLLRADGKTVWVRASTSPLRNPSGQVRRAVGVMEDITEHLRLEASERALERAEASSRTKSEFVSRMSHELRTPLNAMIGFAQLLGLDREPGLVPHQREWTQQIQRAGWHLLEMINETLDLARIESGAVQLALKPVALAPLVGAAQAMVSSAAQQRGVQMAELVAPATPAVMADATRLKQIMTNLLSNAVKYNRRGGVVQVTARPAGAGWVDIEVSDSGLGMTPAQLEALFQPYNRLGREASGIEGTGIGLVISKRLAELMGGTLEARSIAGQGSIFTLTLQAAAAAEAPAPEPTDTGLAPYRQRTVHYVEDNETNIEVMRGVLLQRSQIALSVSTSGLDGLQALRRERPSLVLLDMQLPDISGLELLRHLKQDQELAEIPVIVVSADATTARMQEALTLGAVHYVTKPLDIARFLMLLDEVLEGIDTRWGM